ncbi:MAG TPA: MFS transporter [Chloroflexia bacterium]|nr:MFS transporter [Chloroflexia bacterium]
MTKATKTVAAIFVFFLIMMFQLATGFAVVIVTGVIDAVMINELGVPALLVGFLLGVDFIAQPLRTYIGSLSDRYSFKGLHRLPFILVGGIIMALTYPAMVIVVEHMRDPNYQKVIGEVHNTGNYQVQLLWLSLAIIVFAVNGIGIAMMGTIAMSLMVDVTSERVRGIVAAFSWTLLVAGIVIGSIVSSQLLPDTEGRTFVYSSLYPFFFYIIPGVLMVLVLLTCLGALLKEPRVYGPLIRGRTHVSFIKAVKVISHNRQTRWFFLFIFSMMTFMFMRDILAPAFAGNVFKMSVKDRTALQSVVNGPLLIAMIATGLITLKAAKKLACYAGLGISIVGMLIQALAAFSFKADAAAIRAYDLASQQFANKQINQDAYNAALASWNSLISDNKSLFTIGLVVMGVGLGISVPGLIGMMMDLTDPANAALFMGTWGLAQALGQNLSSFLAGGARDIAYNSFGDSLSTGYALVFLMQAAGMALTIWILSRVSVTKFKKSLVSEPDFAVETRPAEVAASV